MRIADMDHSMGTKSTNSVFSGEQEIPNQQSTTEILQIDRYDSLKEPQQYMLKEPSLCSSNNTLPSQ
jgi:hypothetical protein